MITARPTRPPASVLAELGISQVLSVQPIADGHINDSFAVEHRAGKVLVQRLNEEVFRDAEAVQANIVSVTSYLQDAIRRAQLDRPERRVLSVARSQTGTTLVRDESGSAWRAFRYIDGTRTQLKARSPEDAETAARAFGLFQKLLWDFPAETLRETIPRFHDTPDRLSKLRRAIKDDVVDRLAGAEPEVASFEEHSELATRLDPSLPLRVVHNDAKLSNVLLDTETGEALCVIDLDTVMPGAAVVDFGEMVRSMAHMTAEDAVDLDRVRIRQDLYEAITRGYLSQTATLLRPEERQLLYDAALVMVFENGIRFLTDYLEGDVYYRAERPTQNIDRARTHLALLRSLLAQEARLRALSERA